MANLRKLKVSDIRTDGGTQMREAIHEPTVRLYSELMRDGAEFPPPIAFFDGRDHWLADGFHRLEAHLANEHRSIECEVREGSRRDAVLFSVSANASHGLPLKHGDKRRAVETLLLDPEWGKWSNAAIASRVGCVTNTVHIARRRLVSEGRIAPRDTVTFKSRGKVVTRKSCDGRDGSNDAPNYQRDYLKILATFTPEQFTRWKAEVGRREHIDRYAAAEAVQNVVLDTAKVRAA